MHCRCPCTTLQLTAPDCLSHTHQGDSPANHILFFWLAPRHLTWQLCSPCTDSSQGLSWQKEAGSRQAVFVASSGRLLVLNTYSISMLPTSQPSCQQRDLANSSSSSPEVWTSLTPTHCGGRDYSCPAMSFFCFVLFVCIRRVLYHAWLCSAAPITVASIFFLMIKQRLQTVHRIPVELS